jgi:hypothetical protein
LRTPSRCYKPDVPRLGLCWTKENEKGVEFLATTAELAAGRYFGKMAAALAASLI